MNHQTAHGRTALMLASVKGNVATIKTLLAHGAKVDLKDKHGVPAIGQQLPIFGSLTQVQVKVMTFLKAYDPEGYCFYYTKNQLNQVRVILSREQGESRKTDEGVINMLTDIYNFMSTLDVRECSTQYRFVFTRAKGDIGTFLGMWHRWQTEQGSPFTDLTAARMNDQRRAYIDSIRKEMAWKEPY